MRVALLDAARSPAAGELARAGLGELVAPAAPRVLDVALRARKLGDHLAAVPPAWLALRRGGFVLAHAFSAEDALATRGWHGPLVLTVAAAPRREQIAARRGRLRTMQWALGAADAVLVPEQAVAAALEHWFGVEARVVAGVEAHAALYRDSR